MHPEWIQDDGLPPNALAQPFITDWMVRPLLPQLTPVEKTAEAH